MLAVHCLVWSYNQSLSRLTLGFSVDSNVWLDEEINTFLSVRVFVFKYGFVIDQIRFGTAMSASCEPYAACVSILIALRATKLLCVYFSIVIEVVSSETGEWHSSTTAARVTVYATTISDRGRWSEVRWHGNNHIQATVLDARASRVKWPAQVMSHWYGILFTEYWQ